MAIENELIPGDRQQKRGRAILLLLLIFFLVPSLVVMLMIKFNWKPQGTSVGELLRPPVAMVSPNAEVSFWQDKWHLVYLDAQCQIGCVEKLKALRNLHVSLYKNMLRVKLVLITKRDDVTQIQTQFPDLMVLKADNQQVQQVAQRFDTTQMTPFGTGHLYLVDPLGYYVMRFAPEIPLTAVRKDLSKLLKFAWAG